MKKLLALIITLLPLLSQAQFCNHYTYVTPINLNGVSGATIQNDSTTSITLTSCSNVHIFKCKVANKLTGIAIQLINCTNITIDSCVVENVQQGIICTNSVNTIIQNNYIHNVFGAFNQTYHPIQFITCTRGKINYNKILEDPATTPNTHDQVSLYKSNGVLGDSIQVIGNWIRGGQQVMNGTGPGGFTGGNNGATGINLGDSGGNYQVARYNYVINGGYIGMQMDAKGTNMKMDHNYVYSSRTNISLVGISYYTTGGNGTGNNISYNHINWAKNSGGTYNKYYNPSLTQPAGWTTNTGDSTPDPLANNTMIPTPIVAACSGVVTRPNISYSAYIGTYKTTMIPMSATLVSGSPATSYSAISLPPGCSISSSTGQITGIPTAAQAITTYQIVASNSAGNDTASWVVTINKANLTCVANPIYKIYNTANPTLTYTLISSAPSDTSPTLSVNPTLSTTALTGSAPGTYPITISGAVSSNHNLFYQNSILTVESINVGGIIHGHKAQIVY